MKKHVADSEDKLQAAKDARAYIAGDLSWDAFIMTYGETESDSIGELVYIIEHEPKRGGFLGVREKDWQTYVDSREEAILELERQ